jgi:glyoxylase-like metal-dependent hydrolase (beta-lactamase superfamily II)
VTLEVVHTPGHAPDHACFVARADRVVFCGDLVTPGTTVVIPGTRGGDLEAYLASLARVRGLEAATLLPGHGDPVDRPSAIIDAYVAHRRDRDRQIVAAVHAGCSSTDAIVRRIYPDVSEALRWAAEESVIAHLRKLERDGRVARRGDEWTPPTYT